MKTLKCIISSIAFATIASCGAADPTPFSYEIGFATEQTVEDMGNKTSLSPREELAVCGFQYQRDMKTGFNTIYAPSANRTYALGRSFNPTSREMKFGLCEGGELTDIFIPDDVELVVESWLETGFVTNAGKAFINVERDGEPQTYDVTNGTFFDGRIKGISPSGNIMLMERINTKRSREFPFIRTVGDNGEVKIQDISMSVTLPDGEIWANLVVKCMNNEGVLLGYRLFREEAEAGTADPRRRMVPVLWTKDMGFVELEDVSTVAASFVTQLEGLEFGQIRPYGRYSRDHLCPIDDQGNIVAFEKDTGRNLFFLRQP